MDANQLLLSPGLPSGLVRHCLTCFLGCVAFLVVNSEYLHALRDLSMSRFHVYNNTPSSVQKLQGQCFEVICDTDQ